MKTKRTSAELAEYGKDHIKQWRGSGLRQAEYCRSAGLEQKAFSYWKRKEKPRKSSPAFLEVACPSPSYSQSIYKVVVKDRLELHIGADFDPGILKKLVLVLQSV